MPQVPSVITLGDFYNLADLADYNLADYNLALTTLVNCMPAHSVFSLCLGGKEG